ncbi:kelch domain-containing protein 1 isoform X2 [Protopterus annectens]|uniref:kelch domain-containing protein 1 isoform X2 n=1 Tax=Protopterus annectens TaxID=7888 RepID=UPI001CFA6FB0|nr:kelch domain-containing protein 1 isoform X2 [Protopterus annectens]
MTTLCTFGAVMWEMHLMDGEVPPPMSGSCAACVSGVLYIFGGYDDDGYSNQLYCVNLTTRRNTYTWKKIKNFKGQPPTPRDKLACWVYKERIIYFGGYGSRSHKELGDCFDVHDATWEGQTFWGWNNDVCVFDISTDTWLESATKGVPPQPRAAHACAVVGNKGFVFGGRVKQTRMNDVHYFDLNTMTWNGEIHTNGEKPCGRSWHTFTPTTNVQIFLYGGLSADGEPLSDGWIFCTKRNEWKQLKHLPRNIPRLWHTACVGNESEVMIFGGSKEDLHFLDTGHCNDLLTIQTQPFSLSRISINYIAKNVTVLQHYLHWLPQKLLQQVLKKITFWTVFNKRQNSDGLRTQELE